MSSSQLQAFFAETQLRAFRIAQLAVHSEADALDLVQEAMTRLVEKYRHRPEQEWAPLFYRILQNAIADFFRRNGREVPLDESAETTGNRAELFEPQNSPAQQLDAERLGQLMLDAIAALPLRQQQCFLLRGWEGLSVEETATAMGLTSGSVKTHYFRAVAKLNEILEQQNGE